MQKFTALIGLFVLGLFQALAEPAQADEKLWANCRTCHAITAPDGRVLARGGRSGPNLFALAGRPVAGDTSFKLYSRDLQALRSAGRRWNEGDFVAYLANPDQFLQAATGNPSARSDMHVQMRQGGAALWAWIGGLR
ncbi:MAG: c-type cytochrome [Roseinatronobacter sp.]